MSVDTVTLQAGHVESPKEDASEGILQQLEQQASAEDVKITQTAGAAQSAKQQQQGQATEAKKSESNGAPSSGGGINKAHNTLNGELMARGVGALTGADGIVEGVKAVADVVSDKKSNPAKSHDANKMKKMGMASNPTSFEDIFKADKKKKIECAQKGANITEKMNIASGALSGHKKTTKGMKASQESAAQLGKTCEHARSLGPKMQQVKANINKVREMQGPGRGMAPGLNNESMKSGPRGYVEPKTTTTDDTSAWA